MAGTRRIILVASSASLLLLVAISLATAIEIRAPAQKIFQHSVAQAAKLGGTDQVVGAKAKLNGTDFDRGDIWHGTSLIPGSVLGTPTSTPIAVTATEEGMVGATPTPRASASWSAEGVIGPIATPSPAPIAPPKPPQGNQVPIVAMSYAGSGGPKHCRGNMIQKMAFERPVDQWKNGTCINLPSQARCGIFYSAKGDNCEAQLFNVADCYNSPRTYVNTAVFMPEERPVGALWTSMRIRCGIDVPDAKLIDPSVLGGLLKPKPKPPGQ
jgi:hypothetical protein